VICSSETSVHIRTTRRYISEDGNIVHMKFGCHQINTFKITAVATCEHKGASPRMRMKFLQYYAHMMPSPSGCFQHILDQNSVIISVSHFRGICPFRLVLLSAYLICKVKIFS
jgi:hypothetical protein